MSLSLAVALNVIADLALVAAVAWVMTRAGRLTPHLPARRRTMLAEAPPPLRQVHDQTRRRAA